MRLYSPYGLLGDRAKQDQILLLGGPITSIFDHMVLEPLVLGTPHANHYRNSGFLLGYTIRITSSREGNRNTVYKYIISFTEYS